MRVQRSVILKFEMRLVRVVLPPLLRRARIDLECELFIVFREAAVEQRQWCLLVLVPVHLYYSKFLVTVPLNGILSADGNLYLFMFFRFVSPID